MFIWLLVTARLEMSSLTCSRDQDSEPFCRVRQYNELFVSDSC